MKANQTYGTFTLIDGTGCTVERQNSTNIIDLPAGKYVVVPTSTGVKLKQNLEETGGHDETEPEPLIITTDDGDIRFSPAVIRAYTELFNRLDTDGDNFLCKSEMDSYMMRTEGSPIQDSAFEQLLLAFDGREGNNLFITYILNITFVLSLSSSIVRFD